MHTSSVCQIFFRRMRQISSKEKTCRCQSFSCAVARVPPPPPLYHSTTIRLRQNNTIISNYYSIAFGAINLTVYCKRPVTYLSVIGGDIQRGQYSYIRKNEFSSASSIHELEKLEEAAGLIPGLRSCHRAFADKRKFFGTVVDKKKVNTPY